MTGDKDNHSMVLHLAMPLHAFALAILFTLPVLLIHVLSAVVKVAYTLVHLIFLNDSSAADKLSILNSLCTEMLLHPFMVIDSNSNNSSVRSSTNSKLHSSPERPKTRSMMKKEQKQQVTSGQQLTTICLLFIGHFIGLAIVTVCLVRYSYSHPFLLADNRHYTFYVWKRLLQYPKIRALLGLPYYVTVLVLFSRLRRVQGPLWVTGFMIASCLSLVPTPLLEPRYFTQVVVLALLHSPPTVNTPVVTLWGVKITPRHMLQLSVIGSVSLSILLLYVFLYRPFLWPDGSVARFMP